MKRWYHIYWLLVVDGKEDHAELSTVPVAIPSGVFCFQQTVPELFSSLLHARLGTGNGFNQISYPESEFNNIF